jgi:hypothetical protein
MSLSSGGIVRITTGILTIVGLVGMSVGCDTSPSAPTPLSSPAVTSPVPDTVFSVTAISPTAGLIGDSVRIAGTGFARGATVALDGVPAKVTAVTDAVIVAIAPSHSAGTVDVMVTNPGGGRGTLSGSFTYETVTLTSSPNRVAPGEQLNVSWVAPGKRSNGDWIVFLKIKDSSTSYADGWWQYTPSGTFTLDAPAQPGEYEFRYLSDDGFIDAARSGPVTVTASASLQR